MALSIVEVKLRSLVMIEIFGAKFIRARIDFRTGSSRVRRSKIDPFRLLSSKSLNSLIPFSIASESRIVMSQMLLK